MPIRAVMLAAILVSFVGCEALKENCEEDCEEEYVECLGDEPDSEVFDEFSWEESCEDGVVSPGAEKLFCECTWAYRECVKDC